MHWHRVPGEAGVTVPGGVQCDVALRDGHGGVGDLRALFQPG